MLFTAALMRNDVLPCRARQAEFGAQTDKIMITKIRSLLLIALAFLSLTAITFRADTTEAQQPANTTTLTGLKDRVTIRRDERGIPYIEATNDGDLYFAQGYVTASDRLWQMDLLRRNVRGELAEIFGQGALAERQVEAQGQSAPGGGGTDDESAAVDFRNDVHGCALSYAFAAAWIAARICWKVPHRQMLVISRSMSASVGFGLFLSNSTAAMIWPDWQ